MRERFDELRKKPPTYEELLDFIEQELKKEREECINIAESMRTGWDNEMVNTIDWKDANDWTVDNIINTIKKRT